MTHTPKIAIVADWLTNSGGAEKVVFDLHKCFPDAPIFTAIYNPAKLPNFAPTEIRTSFIQRLPFAKTKHQLYLGLMPYAFESFDLSEFDIVISSSFACAKGVITKPETLHICYCHNPMRYIWDESHSYVKEHNLPRIIKLLATPFLHKIRIWDQLTSNRVDHFIANSKFVTNRIQKYYHRKSDVIHPGIEFTNQQIKINTKKEDFYLAVGRLKPFKRFDLLIETFNHTKENLIIAGVGEDRSRLEALNTNHNTKFVGFVPAPELINLFSTAKAFIFPQSEDFGITPVEAQYFGCPVIAFAKGGCLETVIDGKTGLFFKDQTPKSLREALTKANAIQWNYQAIHQHATKFSSDRFEHEIKAKVSQLWESSQNHT